MKLGKNVRDKAVVTLLLIMAGVVGAAASSSSSSALSNSIAQICEKPLPSQGGSGFLHAYIGLFFSS